MASQHTLNVGQNTHGIILRTSSTFHGQYAYFPLPRAFPTDVASNLDNIFVDSLSNAPHFPGITILDSISSNILYKTDYSFPNLFHVYNLINRSHFSFSFPYHLTFVNAAILIRDSSHFKVLIACINEHPNPLLVEEGASRTRPLVFCLYTSESENWSFVPIDYTLTSDHLFLNMRKPIHIGEDIVCLDLINPLLITYSYWEERIESIPKLVSKWEQKSGRLDETTRYSQCMEQLHCVKINPNKVRLEVYRWMASPQNLWKLVVRGKIGKLWGKVMGMHPYDESYLLMRLPDNDEVFMVDIKHDISFVIINGRGVNCGPECFCHGRNDVLEAATSSEGVQYPSCGILHPHENIEGPEGDIFIVSHFGTQLISPPQNVRGA